MLQHDTLIELKNRVLSIIETDDDGICFGLSAKFLDAFFADDLSKLAARLALFEADGDVDGLMSRIDEVIRQLADGTLDERDLTTAHLKLLDIRAWVESLVMYMYAPMLPESLTEVKRQHYATTHAIAGSDTLKATPPQALPILYFAGSLSELDAYLEKLEASLVDAAQKVGFFLQSDEHSLSIAYDPAVKGWFFIDTNLIINPALLDKTVPRNELPNLIHYAFERELDESFDEATGYEAVPLVDDVDAKTLFSISGFAVQPNSTLIANLSALRKSQKLTDMMAIYNANGATLLHVIVQEGDIDKLRVVITSLDDVDECDVVGNTALGIAAESGREDLFFLLLEHGAAIDAVNDSGNTILHCAMNGGSRAIIKHLVKNGVDINAANDDGVTGLISAVKGNDLALVDYLLQLGACPNTIVDTVENGPAAIHIAALSQNKEMIRLFLKYGGDLTVCMEDGVCALDILLDTESWLEMAVASVQSLDTALEDKMHSKLLATSRYVEDSLAISIGDKHRFFKSLSTDALSVVKSVSRDAQQCFDKQYALVPVGG